jgi:hypothetical protein
VQQQHRAVRQQHATAPAAHGESRRRLAYTEQAQRWLQEHDNAQEHDHAHHA